MLAFPNCPLAKAQQSSGLSRKLHLAGSVPELAQRHPARGTQSHPSLMQQPATNDTDHANLMAHASIVGIASIA